MGLDRKKHSREVNASIAMIEQEAKKIGAEIGLLENDLANARAKLRARERQLKALFDMSRAGVCVTAADTWMISSANPRMAEMFHCAPDELTGSAFSKFIHTPETDLMRNCIEMVSGEIEYVQSEHRFIRKDGSSFQGLFTARCLFDDFEALEGVVVVIYDISEQREAEDALNRIESNYWEIFNATNDVLFVHDAFSAAILDVNTSVEKMFGFTREEILFMNVQDLGTGEPPYSMDDAVELIRKTVEEGPQRFEWRCKRKNGEQFWAEVTLTASHIGGEGRVLGVFRDITDRKEIEQRLQYLSAHDSLTGLFNRAHFEIEFSRLVKGRHYPISLIIADLDGLKKINDTLGHEAGDLLIRKAGDVLRAAFRVEDLIARIGGDEFAVLLPGTDEKQVAVALERIREEEAASNAWKPNTLVCFSLGCSTANTPDDAETLFREADFRMYANKTARTGQHSVGMPGIT